MWFPFGRSGSQAGERALLPHGAAVHTLRRGTGVPVSMGRSLPGTRNLRLRRDARILHRGRGRVRLRMEDRRTGMGIDSPAEKPVRDPSPLLSILSEAFPEGILETGQPQGDALAVVEPGY